LDRYRAKVLEYASDRKSAKVLYVDYGNTATLDVATQLRPIEMGMATSPPALARPVELALLKVP
jgi:hypothetical protein